MTWLAFVFALELGLLPNYGFVMYQPDPEYVIDQHALYTDLEASVEAGGFYLGGAMRCYFWAHRNDYGFSPFQMTYRFDAGWRNDRLNIGFRHYCMHPVVPWSSHMPEKNWEGAYEELFIRLEGKIR